MPLATICTKTPSSRGPSSSTDSVLKGPPFFRRTAARILCTCTSEVTVQLLPVSSHTQMRRICLRSECIVRPAHRTARLRPSVDHVDLFSHHRGAEPVSCRGHGRHGAPGISFRVILLHRSKG